MKVTIHAPLDDDSEAGAWLVWAVAALSAFASIYFRSCEVLRMTLLAPDIVRAILDGRQPRHVNFQAMRGRLAEVPLDWDEHRAMFGFAAAGG